MWLVYCRIWWQNFEMRIIGAWTVTTKEDPLSRRYQDSLISLTYARIVSDEQWSKRGICLLICCYSRHFKQRVLHSRRNKDRQFIDSLTIVVFNEKHCTRYNIRRSTKFAQHINHIVIKMASYFLICIYHIERTSL